MNTTVSSQEPTTTIHLRLRLPILWLAILLLGALFLPDRVWTTLLIGFGGLFLVAYIWVRLLARGLSATRTLRFGWVGVACGEVGQGADLVGGERCVHACHCTQETPVHGADFPCWMAPMKHNMLSITT